MLLQHTVINRVMEARHVMHPWSLGPNVRRRFNFSRPGRAGRASTELIPAMRKRIWPLPAIT